MCGCNKKSTVSRGNVLQPLSRNTLVPRSTTLNAQSLNNATPLSQEEQRLSEDRRQAERLRREAIKRRLNK